MSSELLSALVVGGCGFLGHHIVPKLLEKFSFAQILVLDLRTTHNRFSLVIYYDGDITPIADVQRVLDQIRSQVIIHTASPVVVDFKETFTLYHKINVDGTRVLLECAGQIECTRVFVYTFNTFVVHDSMNGFVNVEKFLSVFRYFKQREIYFHIKGSVEDFVFFSNRKYLDMLIVAIRPADMFGEKFIQMLSNLLNVYYIKKTKIQLRNNRN